MSNGLGAVSAISGGADVAKPDAGIEMHDKAADNKASSHDAASFASMMQSPDVANVAKLGPVSKAEGGSIIEKIAATQTADMRDLFQSSRDLVKATPNLSMAEVVSAGTDLTLKMTVTTTQFQIAAAVGKSSGSAVQTLMKNQ